MALRKERGIFGLRILDLDSGGCSLDSGPAARRLRLRTAFGRLDRWDYKTENAC